MTMTVDELLQRLDEIFSPLVANRRDGVTREFVRQLAAFEGNTLEDAYHQVMDDWTKPARPLPAIFRHVCLRLRPVSASDQARLDRAAGMRRELAGLIERTLQWLGADLTTRAAGAGIEAAHYRHCVAHRIETLAWRSWAWEGKIAPQVAEFSDADWLAIDAHAATRQRCAALMGARTGSFVRGDAAAHGYGNRGRARAPQAGNTRAATTAASREILAPEQALPPPVATPHAKIADPASGDRETGQIPQVDEIEAF